MGYVLPGWADEVLDFIGINWPNVDEDDYREMADAVREFAENFDEHGAGAHAAVSRILASSEGSAVDSLREHWGKVNSSHLKEVPEVAKLFATACDAVADIIHGMKVKAEVELGVMAASAGIAIGAAFVSGGLSLLLGAAETAAMREVIRRIIKEAAEEIVERLLAEVTEPVTAKLEKMTEDMILDLADDALSLPAGEGAGGGKSATQLNSAGGAGGAGGTGGGGAGGGRVRIDHDEFENGAGKLSNHGADMHTNSLTSLDRAGVLPLVVERTHISGYTAGRFFGPSWASSLDERLELAGAGGELWWHRVDGSSLRYHHAPDMIGERVLPAEGHRVPLTRAQGSSAWDLAVTESRTGLTRPTGTRAGTEPGGVCSQSVLLGGCLWACTE